MFILCGTPDDIVELKNGSLDVDAHIAFILIDLYKSVIYQSLLIPFLVSFFFFFSFLLIFVSVLMGNNTGN